MTGLSNLSLDSNQLTGTSGLDLFIATRDTTSSTHPITPYHPPHNPAPLTTPPFFYSARRYPRVLPS